MRYLVATAAAALAVAVTVAACGVGPEDTAREIQPPAGQSPTTATPAPTATGPFVETLFLVRDGALVPVERRTSRQPTPATLIDDLVAGPTAAEANRGLTSSLLGTDVVAGVDVTNGVARIGLADTIEDTGRTDEIAALGQIVCTLTSYPGIIGVEFTRDGQIIKVPRADASLTAGPLTAADYLSLTSPSPSAS